MQSGLFYSQVATVCGAKRDAPNPASLTTDPHVFHKLRVDTVAVYDRQWRVSDVLHNEPLRRSLAHDPLILGYKVAMLLPRERLNVPHLAKQLARRPTDYPLECPSRRVEGANIAAPEKIRAAYHAEPFLLKGAI
jgi:hypothetical protein